MKPLYLIGTLLFALIVGLGMLGVHRVRERSRLDDEKVTATRTLVDRWADQFDRDTTDTGIYRRWPNETLPENDAWGRPLRVTYSQGGVAENLEVRSLGPDGVDHTVDDVVAVRLSTNLKGIGHGIVQGSEKVAANSAKGAVKGIVAGVKESIRGEK